MKLTIEIDDALAEFVNESVALGHHGSPGVFVERLIIALRDGLADDSEIAARLMKMAQSGRDVTPEERRRVRDEVLAPRQEELRKLVQEGVDSLERGEVFTYETEDELVADIQRLAAEKRAGGQQRQAS